MMWLFGALVLILLGILISGPLKRRLADLRRGGWRPGAGVFAIGAMVAGLILIVRDHLAEGMALLALGAASLITARVRSQANSASTAPPAMDRAEAASILGVSETASAAEVQAAYVLLMRLAHPDTGGSTGLASQLNRARAAMKNPPRSM